MTTRLGFIKTTPSRVNSTRLEKEILTLKKWGKNNRRKERTKKRTKRSEEFANLELLNEAEIEILNYYKEETK